MDKAKVFWSGRSQAVRLPKKYRFDTDEVTIRREGESIVITATDPAPKNEWAWLEEIWALGPLDQDFVDAALDRPSATDDDIDPGVVDFFK